MSDTVNSPVLINSSSNLETINNTIQVASNVSDIASRAISFTKKTWIDNADSGTPITAADMNRLEQAIFDLNTNIQSLQDSVSQLPVFIGGMMSQTTYDDGTFFVDYVSPTGAPPRTVLFQLGPFIGDFEGQGGSYNVIMWSVPEPGSTRFRIWDTSTGAWAGTVAVFGYWIAMW